MSENLVQPQSLYDQDYCAWVEEQAQILSDMKEGNDGAKVLDYENLIEEVLSLGRTDKDAVRGQIIRICIHLLKWRYQPERQGSSWWDSVRDGRDVIARKIDDSPSIKREIGGMVLKEWKYIKRCAIDEMTRGNKNSKNARVKLGRNIPDGPIFTVDEIISHRSTVLCTHLFVDEFQEIFGFGNRQYGDAFAVYQARQERGEDLNLYDVEEALRWKSRDESDDPEGPNGPKW